MGMFALGITPLVTSLKSGRIKQIWYADDAAATGFLNDLKTWWDQTNMDGPKYGYYPNSKKTWLIVKEEKEEEAERIFNNTGVKITTSGRPYLGAPIGTTEFKKDFICEKVDKWKKELEKLSRITRTQPQSAYAGYTHSFFSKITYTVRTTKDIQDLLQPIEEVIRCQILPTLTGRPAPTDEERTIFSLPTRYGGLGIRNPTRMNEQFQDSRNVTQPLVNAIREQSPGVGDIPRKQRDLKKN